MIFTTKNTKNTKDTKDTKDTKKSHRMGQAKRIHQTPGGGTASFVAPYNCRKIVLVMQTPAPISTDAILIMLGLLIYGVGRNLTGNTFQALLADRFAPGVPRARAANLYAVVVPDPIGLHDFALPYVPGAESSPVLGAEIPRERIESRDHLYTKTPHLS